MYDSGGETEEDLRLQRVGGSVAAKAFALHVQSKEGNAWAKHAAAKPLPKGKALAKQRGVRPQSQGLSAATSKPVCPPRRPKAAAKSASAKAAANAVAKNNNPLSVYLKAAAKAPPALLATAAKAPPARAVSDDEMPLVRSSTSLELSLSKRRSLSRVAARKERYSMRLWRFSARAVVCTSPLQRQESSLRAKTDGGAQCAIAR